MSLDFRSVCDRTDRKPVRTGSAAEWQTADNGGQERSPTVRQPAGRSTYSLLTSNGGDGPVEFESPQPLREPSRLLPTRHVVGLSGLTLRFTCG